jgi:alkylhydroperoxidase/carboxymuconolactone decarboxylase family protein YurZ
MTKRSVSAVIADAPSAAVPRSWRRLADEFPALTDAYDALSEVCRRAGPLDEASVWLVKLAVSVGAHAPRTIHAHAKKALRAGADPAALRQVAIVALPTVGLPAALDALQWIDESINEQTSEQGGERYGAACND